MDRTLRRETERLTALRSRPCLAAPTSLLDRHAEEVERRLSALRRTLTSRLDVESAALGRLGAQVRALSPAATLARGYAVVQRADASVVRSPKDVRPGEPLRLRVAGGDIAAQVAR